jgi:drug/metabolite transporter (DMT)-like permease
MTSILQSSALAPTALGAGETLLSLYPIIVKSSPLSVPIQAFSRILIYTVIPLFFANYSALSGVPLWKWGLAGATNLAHIWSSYEGFKRLEAGFATTLLYLYPIINLVLARVILGEELPLYKVLLFIIPVMLVYQIYKERNAGAKTGEDGRTAKRSVATSVTTATPPATPPAIPAPAPDSSLGIAFMLLSALTESMLYILIKTTPLGTNMWNPILFVYSGALSIAVMTAAIYSYSSPDRISTAFTAMATPEFGTISFYNAAIGMIGYMLRFWSIPRVSTILYSILSFTGVITSHIFGYFAFNETITSTISVYLLLFIASLVTIKLV